MPGDSVAILKIHEIDDFNNNCIRWLHVNLFCHIICLDLKNENIPV